MKFNYSTIDELKGKIDELGLKNLPFSDDVSCLGDSVKVGERVVPNRIAIQPMEGCDGTASGEPDELTVRRYDRFAESGAGLVWAEAVAIVEEGRANPRQLYITENNIDAFKKMNDRIRELSMKKNGFAPIIIMQATHSGRYSKPTGVPAPLIAYNNPIFEGENPIDKSRIISDDKLFALEEQYGKAAKMAEEAGFDGIDVKCCHRYLNSELLSAFTRDGAFGGSFDNRTRLLRNGIKNATDATGKDFIITTRMNVYDGFEYPYGWGVKEGNGKEVDLTEPIKLIDILHNQLGVKMVDVTIGNPYVNSFVNRPADATIAVSGEHPLIGVDRMFGCVGEIQKAFPELVVMGSGVSYMREYAGNLAAGAVKAGMLTMQGFGREAFAYPQFANDLIKNGTMDKKMCCITCGKCTELMRAGGVAGCVIKDSEVYMPLYKKYCMNK